VILICICGGLADLTPSSANALAQSAQIGRFAAVCVGEGQSFASADIEQWGMFFMRFLPVFPIIPNGYEACEL